MKLFKQIPILAMISLLFIVACKNDDDNDVAPTVTPEVISSNPAEGNIDVSTNSVIQITFNKDMDVSSINTSSFTLKKGAVSILGTVSYSNKTATFTPINNMEIATAYSARLTAEAKDLDGNKLAGDYTFGFTTGTLVDIIPPEIISIDPLDNALAVVRNKVISVSFSENMNAASFTSTSFVLVQGSTSIPGSIQYANKTAQFIPNNILDPNLSFTATVNTEVEDMAGNAIAITKAWTFTTGSESALSVVNLRASGNYVILAKTAINNSPTSSIIGHLGLSPAATSFITGFGLTNATGYATSPQITGKIYAADMAAPTGTNLTTAVENMITAYNDAAGRSNPDFLELGAGNIGGLTLDPGLYKWTSTVSMPSDITISGSPDDVWIFQISGDLTMSSAVNITLSGGAKAENIFWQVAGEVVLGSTSHFEGIILSMTGITFQTGASLHGRALAQTAVILDANAVTMP